MTGTRTRENVLYAILSGLLLTASFPPGRSAWMAWFAVVPLLWALKGSSSPAAAFKIGLWAGLAHYLTLIYWIVFVLGHYGGIHILISLLILVLFCLYLSIYTALFSLMIRFIGKIPFSVFVTAGLWVALEYARAHLFTGFPWCLLGYSQYRNLQLLQIADVAGVYGLSFVILTVNGLIYTLLLTDRPFSRPFFKSELVLLLVLLSAAFCYGPLRTAVLEEKGASGPSLRVAVVQGNVDQSLKWNPAYQEKTIEKYERLTLEAGRSKPQLILWPETSVPFFFQDAPKFSERVAELPGKVSADLIFGSPAYVKTGNRVRYYNRAYALSGSGEILGSYDKIHLVPFGEYVPLKKFLPFIHKLVVAAGDFAKGNEIKPIRLKHASCGILICFEVIFPELARAHVLKGADILVNLTNDAWFGRTSAPYQHLAMAVFRAVENRRPVIRAANTGISAFIDARGRILRQGKLFEEEVLVHRIRIPSLPPGFYTKRGDIFPVFLIIMSLIILFYRLCYRRPH